MPTEELQDSAQAGDRDTIFIVKDLPLTKADMQRTSFIGGRPLAPEDFKWPIREPTSDELKEGRKRKAPFHFVCQIDCSALPPSRSSWHHHLPDEGIIYFFYGLDTEGYVEAGDIPIWKVVYCQTKGKALHRLSLPSGLRLIEIGSELPVDAKGRCRKTKELGYMPISFAAGRMAPDHAVSWKEKRAHREKRRNAKLEFMGTPPAKPETDLSKFSMSVRNAKTWVAYELDITSTRIDVMTEQLDEFDAGKRGDHQGKCFFDELKSIKRKAGEVSFSDEQIWQEIADGWRKMLRRFKYQLPIVQKLWAGLNKLSENELLTAELKDLFQLQMNFSKETSVVGHELDSKEARDIRQYLLAHYSVEELKLDNFELSFASFERKAIENNENHLLGYPDEVQSESFTEAFLYAQSKGWVESHHSESDLRLLLQLDSCWAGTGMMWGDAGKAYFFILDEDLKARRFDRVSHVLHGH